MQNPQHAALAVASKPEAMLLAVTCSVVHAMLYRCIELELYIYSNHKNVVNDITCNYVIATFY